MHRGCEDVPSLFYHLIWELVDHPDELIVRVVAGAQTSLLEVYAHREDVRKVIGSQGAYADALRTILTSVRTVQGTRFLLEIIESEIPRPTGLAPIPEPISGDLPTRLEHLLSSVARHLATRPEAVAVSWAGGAHTLVFAIAGAPEDVARLVGRQGRMAQAIRTILGAIGGRHRLKLLLEVVEPGRPTAPSRSSAIAGDRGEP